MRLLTVIPARLGSTRLPHKPLRFFAGEPLIRAVVRNAVSLGLPGELVVATDDARVAEAVRPLGVPAVLTASTHRSGTERAHEVARNPRYAEADIVLNLQGDEPFVPGEAVFGALARIEAGDEIGTAAHPLSDDALADPNRVKVEVDMHGRALRFSRRGAWGRGAPGHVLGPVVVLQHIGIYAFTKQALERWMRLPVAAAEASERLEQLRPLEAGMTIGVAALAGRVRPGVDTEEDLRMAEAIR